MSSGPAPRRRRIAGERRRPQDQAEAGDRSPAPEARTPAPPSPPPSPARTTTAGPTPTQRERPTEHRTAARPARPAPRGLPRLAVTVPLVVLTLLGLTYLVLVLVGVPRVTDFQDVREAEDARVAAESAPSIAERAAEAILAYDHRSLDADQAAATKFMTADFAEEFSTTFEKTVRPAARTYKAQVTVDVRGSSVVRASAEQVKVLLFLDQTTNSTANQRPQVALNRVEFVMVPEDGTWKVDDISSY